MLLSKLESEDWKLSRIECLKRLSEVAKMERRAKKLVGYHNDNFGEQQEAGNSPSANDGDAVIANRNVRKISF